MKTSKKLTAVILILVMAITVFIPATFSWYDHNDELSGNKMQYQRSGLPVSAGDDSDITVITKRYKTEYEHNNGEGDAKKLYYDTKGNKEYGDEITGNDTINASFTHYYGTTIKNKGDSPAYVNVYLKDFTNNPNNYIGTLQPSLTYKNLSSSVHLKNQNVIRVYFQYKEVNDWSKNGAKTYLVYKTKSGASGYKEITSQIDNTKDTGGILGGIKTLYVDLEKDTTEFFFATDAANSGFKTNSMTTTIPWYRTNTITNIQSETGYYLTGTADDTTWHAQYTTFGISGGISVKTSYDAVTINKNQRAYITLNKGTNYTGASASYEVTAFPSADISLNSNVNVNNKTGLVTATNSLGNGNNIAYIKTTITGSLGDTMELDTFVSNPETLRGATVAMNVEVPGKHKDESGNTVDGETEIVWYVQNNGSAKCEFSKIYFTK